MSFKDKVVIVTGSGAGIGREAAVMFAKEGAKVVVNSTKSATGEETLALVKAAGGDAIYVQADVSKAEEIDKIIAETLKTYGKIDVLVNNAGIVLGGTIEDAQIEDFDRTWEVNVRGPFMFMQKVVPIMKQQGGGCIVNTTSIVATKGVKNRVAYSASKGALLSMSRAAAADLVRDNIRINCVAPGTTLTPSLEDRINSAPDPIQAKKDFFDRQPIGRLGMPSEIAKAILFAADDEAGFMDGVNIQIDGGMSI